MNKIKLGFYASIGIAIITVTIGFFALADIIQWVIYFPDSFTFWGFNNRVLLMVLGLLSVVAAIVLNFKYKYIRKMWMGGFIGLYLFLFVSGFIAPTYIMFKSEHHKAEYVSISKVPNKYINADDEVLVMVVNGDARAFPNKWIVQSHIAGGQVGGEEVVMTYCGLSHVGQAYNTCIDDEKLDLRVMTQLKNNLVMYDANSQEPIPQLEGVMQNSKRSLETIPSTVMPYASFKTLYPDGKVYIYQHKHFVDRMVYKMLDAVIYADGGQYDKASCELSFPSIKHDDERLHAKEQVYGVIINGQAIAYTKNYILKNDGIVTDIIGGQAITIKYFVAYDFVDVFYGNVPGVDPYGYVEGEYHEHVSHQNMILWKVWANINRDTELKS